jgi:hypothetical protein
MELPLQTPAVSRGRAVRVRTPEFASRNGVLPSAAGKKMDTVGKKTINFSVCPGGFLCGCAEGTKCCVDGDYCCCGSESGYPICQTTACNT